MSSNTEMELNSKDKRLKKAEVVDKARKKNIAQRKKFIQIIRKINQLIETERDREKLIKKICNSSIKNDGLYGVWIGLLDYSSNFLTVVEAGLGKKFTHLVENLKIGEFPDCFKTSLKNSSIFISNSTNRECETCSFLKFFRNNMEIIITLEYRGKIYGVLSLILSKDFVTKRDEIEIFKDIARTIAFALYNIDLEENRKHIEIELISAKKNFEQIFNTSLPTFVTDKNHKIIEVNKFFCALIRMERENILGKYCFDIWQENPCAIRENPLGQVLEKGVKCEFEVEKKFNGGTRIYLIMNSIPFRDPKGEIIGAINSFVDITKYKIATQKLKESERNYKNIIENTKDGIIIVGFDGKIKFISHQISSMLGDNLVKLESSFYNYIHPDDRDFIVKLFQQFLIRKSPLEENIIEFRVLHEKGNYIWLSSSTKDYYDKDGNIAGFISLLRDITKKKEFEKALKESEMRYRGLFENAPISIWEENFSEIKIYLDTLKKSGVDDLREYFEENNAELIKCASMVKILDVNQNTLDIYKAKTKKELLKGLINVFTDNSFLIFKKEILHLYKGFTSFSAETTNKTLTGDQIEIFLKLNILPGHEDSWSRVLVTILDITEHKKAEEALKDSEHNYKDLFENSPDPIIIANMDGEIVDCNSATEISFGYKKSDFLSNKDTQISNSILKLLRSKEEKIYIKEPKDHKFHIQELKVNRKDGISVWVRIQPSIIRIGKENFLYLIFHDITRIKQSERDLLKLERTFEDLDALIENAPLAIILLHQNAKILRANEEAQTLLEFKHDELLNLDVFKLFESNNIDAVKKHYNDDVYNLKASNKIETQIKTKYGKIVDIEVKSTTLKVSDNLVIQSYFSDITERKNYEKNRQLLLDQLIESLEFKTKFLATMSHELRTPLNSLLGFSQLLLMESYGKINNEQRDFLSDIKSAGEHLLLLIDSILDLSKIDIGKFKLTFRTIRLQYLIEEVKTIIRPLYIKKKLAFLLEGVPSSASISVDPMHFKRILYNLLSNAIKFSQKGMITFKVIERTDHWEFIVKDMGVGIAKQDFEVVFREFGRVENDKIKNVPGTGLGLALTKRLVNLHGGNIWFESELGKGTTFFFTIPKREEIDENLI